MSGDGDGGGYTGTLPLHAATSYTAQHRTRTDGILSPLMCPSGACAPPAFIISRVMSAAEAAKVTNLIVNYSISLKTHGTRSCLTKTLESNYFHAFALQPSSVDRTNPSL